MNVVFIATSLDGMIADQNGSVHWLDAFDGSETDDHGFAAFMAGIDAIVMGRTTFETVLGFDVGWPYDKPVYVLSTSRKDVPEDLDGKAEFLSGKPADIQAELTAKGHVHLYIDGGRVIQSFLAAGLIDRMILTRAPVLLGGGVPLFGDLPLPQTWHHARTTTLSGGMIQSVYEKMAA